MAGIDDVARRAQVSTATVSRTLSGRGPVSSATRERVLRAASDLGYVVSSAASSLATGRTRNIGVLVPILDRWFFSRVLTGIAATLQRNDYDVALYALTAEVDERSRVFATSLRRQRVDGVIVVSMALARAEIAQLGDLGLPVIAMGGQLAGLRSLTVNELEVARTATEHLLGLGHRDIAHIGLHPQFEGDFHIPSQRRRGFESALADAGVAVRDDRFAAGDFTMGGGHEAATRLLRDAEKRPTAIFAASDEMAIGAILAARELGLRVPQDLSVVGVDGHDLGAFFGLTTVDQFPGRQGERVAAAMIAALHGSTSEPPVDLDFALVERTSTAPPA
ncbi:LacI family DNA-binding transcriptional regulator [Microbacterium sp. cf332]|uniref:LacI family DNA-binding transcriptional regulator n=1 Tax=Microbacterium sp. cf332 TaxID=1761804 RepID=UPI000880203B|nr:LacI family DNA-binding transcriptional regulator [Microbacterium sp. cf332]SDQ60436.1 DNA-binding transcriptional regulator, LacI/PurR family [Microbacterium sp. cf332]